MVYLVLPIFIIILILGIYVQLNKGKVGEKAVSTILSRLPSEKYTVLNDVMVKTPAGTSQIDHIVVSEYGIFVIETKYYKGIITGSMTSEYWVKNVYGHKYQFRNPVLQNEGHVRAINRVLSDLGTFKTIPLVVFSNQATLKVNAPSYMVTHWINVNPLIKMYAEPVIPTAQVNLIINRLKASNIVEHKARKEHAEYAHRQGHITAAKIDSGICPRCGGKLVERSGAYGPFLGCSNYPQCKFTKKVER